MFRIATLSATLFLTACGTAPTHQGVPPQGIASHSIGASPAVAETSTIQQPLDSDRSIVYIQQFGGGGVAVGVLLGPIGVMANAAMVGNITKADAALMQDKIPVKARQLFDAAARKNGLDLARADTGSAITPYLYVVKVEGERLLVASAMLVEQQQQGAAKWVGKYMYQLPATYTVAELAQLDPAKAAQLQEAAAQGFDELVRRLQQEKQDAIAAEKPVTLRSEFLMPRFGFDMPASVIADTGDITWLRTFGGVYGLRKASVTVTPR